MVSSHRLHKEALFSKGQSIKKDESFSQKDASGNIFQGYCSKRYIWNFSMGELLSLNINLSRLPPRKGPPNLEGTKYFDLIFCHDHLLPKPHICAEFEQNG